MKHLEKPQLRALEVIPVELDGRRGLCLRDPIGLSEDMAVVFEPMAVALELLDGRHTLEQAHTKLRRYLPGVIGIEDLRRLVVQLDEQYLLDGPHIEARHSQLLLQYRRGPARQASLAGMSYPAEREKLVEYLDSFYTAPGGPGGRPESLTGAGSRGSNGAATNGGYAAALVPHVDLARGGALYAQTYKRIAEDPGQPRRFVVLGTGHALAELVAATDKEFETPLGSLRCDRAFLSSLQATLDFDLYSGELTHRSEHSIEFQALYLAHLFGGRSDVTLVPILCGSFHEFVGRGVSPRTSETVESFVAGLRKTLEENAEIPTMLIGAVDLSHMGPHYGDSAPLSSEDRQRIESDDRRMLAKVLKGDAEGFYDAVASEGDRRRICGLSSIYLLLRCIEPRSGELLGYGQANDQAGTSIVSFTSVVFPRA